ncbi:MAG: zinc ABC transporter substrate-binding protein [Deltaproteobacteria bacterium]|nr:zinc ABC transporter substrate-binding protein [Deltaproteobacteria bacterium]
MKKLIILFNLSFLILKPIPSLAKINIVATLPSLGALASEVGGDQVQVKTLARGNQDAHFLEAKPSYVVVLNRADLLIHNGMELENAWLDPILLQSKNPKIQRGQEGYLDASQAIIPLDVPTGTVDRSLGDIHPQGNPHYLLDPRNLLKIASLIENRLSKIDPDHASLYQNHRIQLQNRLQEKIKEWKSTFEKNIQGKPRTIISYHKTFNYLANWLGLEVLAYVEPLPGIPPNARHSKQLVELIQAKQIPLLVMASYYPKKVPDYLQSKTGIKILVSTVDIQEVSLEGILEHFENLIKELSENL